MGDISRTSSRQPNVETFVGSMLGARRGKLWAVEVKSNFRNAKHTIFLWLNKRYRIRWVPANVSGDGLRVSGFQVFFGTCWLEITLLGQRPVLIGRVCFEASSP
ncbi:MAG: hypothetical protein VX435_13840 [Planctomycetota bacterium]|nr:hypothetical protein [Planctomycetota bacterium]